MNTYILILVCILGLGELEITNIEFSSKEKCEIAAKEILENKYVDRSIHRNIAICVEK